MKSLILITLFIAQGTIAFAGTGDSLSHCSEMSKNPACWERPNTLGSKKLVCSSDGTVFFHTFHGEGPGCGSSGKTIISSQKRDWSTKSIFIVTAWLPALNSNSPDTCHYWGPIHGGGAVETYSGTWKVYVDGKYMASYTYLENFESDSDSKASFTKDCEIN